MHDAPALRDEGGDREQSGPGLVERLRGVHLEMLDAVLSGGGLARVAELAARAAGAPVAIVVPRLGEPIVFPAADAGELARYVAARLRDRPVSVPEGVTSELPLNSGDERVGSVLLLDAEGGAPPLSADAGEYLHLAMLATLTELALSDAKEEAELNLRGSLFAELRRPGGVDGTDIVKRAGRLGCEVSRGALVLCAELSVQRPRHVAAVIAGEQPGALVEVLDDRVYALLPAAGGELPHGTVPGAGRLADRLRAYGVVGISSFYADPAQLGTAMREAELVLDVLRTSEDAVGAELSSSTYRLLFRVLAYHPEEVRSLYEQTLEPVVRYDRQYSTDLVGTLDSYLAHNCSMNATAAAIYAHRHTVAYRLDRLRELSGLDASVWKDRERLSLGLKAYRILAPRLPR